LDGFDPRRIEELGKNPGLGVRTLHERGITGRGVSIAIIDLPLLVGHQEVADQLKHYEHVFCDDETAHMHGTAVASIAVGRTVGVAPEAGLYQIAHRFDKTPEGRADLTRTALVVERILQINDALPADEKIRVISYSLGFRPANIGFEALFNSIQRASERGILVLSTSCHILHGTWLGGLGRHPMADPDDFTSYGEECWWANHWKGDWPPATTDAHDQPIDPKRILLVPADSRCVAGPCSTEDYAYYRAGGWSWAVPWFAGLYALACQVKPEITPEEYWEVCLETGRPVNAEYEGREMFLGNIVDPVAVIERLQGK